YLSFSFHHPSPPPLYTLSLHDALPISTTLPYDVVVLPGHGVPFYGLKTRIKQLADHHEDRCRLIAEACRETAKTSKELVPVVFQDRKSTRLNSSHLGISYAVFCLKKKK